MVKTLYICYFGVREPLVQTQVLPYLRELRREGVKGRKGEGETGNNGEREPIQVSLLTFEPDFKKKWTRKQIAKEKAKLAAEGIDWHCLAYHKRPSAPATAFDVLNGAWYVARLLRREKFDVLHCRVHIPTLMGAIARKLSKHKPKLLFDIRGFFPEEYTDAGVWPEGGWLYRSAKRAESWLLDEADGFVVLTKKAREILFPEVEAEPLNNAGEPAGKAEPFPTSGGKAAEDRSAGGPGCDKWGRPVEVIPCCVDFAGRFPDDRDELRSSVREEMGLDSRFVITHLGALGGLYLTNDIADLLDTSRQSNPKTFAMFLTQSDPSLIVPLIEKRGFGPDDYFVRKVPPADVQRFLFAADTALSFVRAGYATKSRSPTKIPEYLACGLPIIANRGIGDVDNLIEENGVGVLLDNFSPESYRKALLEIEALGDIVGKCRETAAREFDLEKVAGERYRRLYRRILG